MIATLLLLAAPYDFSAQRLTTKVITLVKEQYAHPEKIDPAAMFRGAIERLGAEYPNLKVSFAANGDVNVRKRKVAVLITALGQLSFSLNNVAEAVAADSPQFTKANGHQMERSLINGMLAALDPAARYVINGAAPPKSEGVCQFPIADDGVLLLPCAQPAR
jgi:hypothetical protein